MVSWLKIGKLANSVFGSLWFLQLRIQQYFLEPFVEAYFTHMIQPSIYGDLYMQFPFLLLSTCEVADTLVKIGVMTLY